MRNSSRMMVALGFIGCTPVLTSPDQVLNEEQALLDWEAPENQWETGDPPPASLVEEGFGQGDVVPDIRLVDQFGDEVALWQFYGMVIALDVSTIWCAPCRILAEEVEETWHDYRDEGFMYLTLLPEDTSGDVPDQSDLVYWGEEYGITAPILSDGMGYSAEIEPDAIYPHIMVIDRDMTVAVPDVEPAEDATIRAAIEALL